MESTLTSESSAKSRSAVQSISRGFAVLEAVVAHDVPVGVTDLSRQCDLPVGTIHRLVQSLYELGYVDKDENSKYFAGPRLVRLTGTRQKTVAAIAQPYLDRIAEELGETVAVGTLKGGFVVGIARTPGTRSIRIHTSIGVPSHPHASALGKLLLGQMPLEQIHHVLDHTHMPRFTPATITDRDALLSAIATAQDLGYAVNEGEQEEGMRCVAVPITYDGAALGFSLSAPTLRMPDDVLLKTVETLRTAAKALADDLRGVRYLTSHD